MLLEALTIGCEVLGSYVAHEGTALALTEAAAIVNHHSHAERAENVINRIERKLKAKEENGRARWENITIKSLAAGIRLQDKLRGIR